ncbi:MAG: DUF3570 domain-containing protein [Pseudomonadales bacterium]|nr:DUF3570 domain-containing protein [Pseudomonadales bacterium]
MQLDKKKRVFDLIALASCSLIGVTGAASVSATSEAPKNDWKVDTALLYYSEDERVTAVEPVIGVTKTFANDKVFSSKLTVDTLTGSSHNGAAVSDKAQTFTTPSGNDTYTVASGDVPLDDTFLDTRVALTAQMKQLLDRLSTITYGANFSTEYDYRSVGINGGYARDFNQRNTTLALGLSFTQDAMDPEGGTPVLYSLMGNQEKEGTDTRTIVDALFGITQVIDRNTIMQFNYGIGSSSGYHNDPFKVVTIVDEVNDDLAYMYESRPDSRVKHSFYWRTKHHFEKDMVDLSLRLMTDDWGVTSETLDVRYRWSLSENSYLEPHIRYYTQSEADFYVDKINSGSSTAEQVSASYKARDEDFSADYRLGNLDTTTLGLKWGTRMAGNQELSARIEFYQQSGGTEAADLDALITQIGYTFYF